MYSFPNILCILAASTLLSSFQTCNVSEVLRTKRICETFDEIPDEPVFILYSVNPVEGFNLRRDVFLRMAIFLKKIRKIEGYKNSFLVLPVFNHLYHWKSNFPQSMFWNHFFDLSALKSFTSVIDMWEFFDIIRNTTGRNIVEIDEV